MSASPPRCRPRTASRKGATGQTSVQLDPLPASKDYYWRARAQAPGGTGSFSDPFKFTIGGAITLAAPTPIGPLTNAETTPRPALRVSNVEPIGTDRRRSPTSSKSPVIRASVRSSSPAPTPKASTKPASFPTSDLPTRVPPVLESVGDRRRQRRHEPAERGPELHAAAVVAGGNPGPAVGCRPVAGTNAAGYRRTGDDGRQLAGADAALPAGQRLLPEPGHRDAENLRFARSRLRSRTAPPAG